jgi:hypothetical protein
MLNSITASQTSVNALYWVNTADASGTANAAATVNTADASARITLSAEL